MRPPEIYTAYAPDADITFIMRDTFNLVGDELESTAVVGFYYGEPDEQTTREFIGKTTAYYG